MKRYKKLFEDNFPFKEELFIAYHAMGLEYLEITLRRGRTPSGTYGKEVYLSNEPRLAIGSSETNVKMDDAVILKVFIPKIYMRQSLKLNPPEDIDDKNTIEKYIDSRKLKEAWNILKNYEIVVEKILPFYIEEVLIVGNKNLDLYDELKDKFNQYKFHYLNKIIL